MAFLTSILLSSLISVARAETEETEFICSKDAHVRQNNPTSNYGSESSFVVGYKSGDRYETYLFFDLSGVSDIENVESIELDIPIYYAPESVQIEVYTTEGTWEESTITWNNKPSVSELLGYINVEKQTSYTTTIYSLDITSIASDKTSLGICLRAPSASNYAQGDSKDGMSTGSRIVVKHTVASGGGGGGDGSATTPAPDSSETNGDNDNVSIQFVISGYDITFLTIALMSGILLLIFKLNHKKIEL